MTEETQHMAKVEPINTGGDDYHRKEGFVILRLSDFAYRGATSWVHDIDQVRVFDEELEAVQFAQALGYEVEGYIEDDIDEAFPNWMEDDEMAAALAKRNSTIR